MKKPYEILPYTINTLKSILSEKSGALKSVVENKLHTLYFEHYFSDLQAKTIVIENDYIDRDFMEDYAGFYSRCFNEYKRTCTRLHFFSVSFTPKQFAYFIINKGKHLTHKKFKESYLGFIVIKRLPKTFIGRTCLITYDPDDGRRFFPIVRKYPVGLFGINLVVYETLAFQEQDRGAAACATSALWTVFQGTGKQFQHPIPSPVEITQIATKIPDESVPGSLPSIGLTGRQAIYAVRHLGLEADLIDAQHYHNLQGAVYAYLRAGIPLLLKISLYDISIKDYPKFCGLHAVAVTGFSLGRDEVIPYGDHEFNERSSRIDKIYAHDDQVGPFARMELDGFTVLIKEDNHEYKLNSLSTSLIGANLSIGSIRAVPHFLLIPLYPKIRIRFKHIRELIISFDIYIKDIINERKLPLPTAFEWDIFLTTVNQFKSEVRSDKKLPNGIKRKIILYNMPRFLWRVRAFDKGDMLFEFIFDATDITQGKCFVYGINRNNILFSFLESVAKEAQKDDLIKVKPYWRILEWFCDPDAYCK